MSPRTSFDAAAARHLFRRATFGAGRARIDRAVEEGLETSVDELLSAREPDPDIVAGEELLCGLESIEPLAGSWFARILSKRAPLTERIALLWHGHFATSWTKVQDVRLMHRQVTLFREHGLGDFRELLHAIATDPAMLLWLDGDRNERGQPNENFAREVFELFGLGRGHCEERDIQEAARAFTGWSVQRRRFLERTDDHDPGQKTVLGSTGYFDGHDVIDLVLAHPRCAQHVADRLLRELVCPEPTAAEVEHWAGRLVEHAWRIDDVLRELLTSQLFFSERARRARIASPVEMVAITAAALGADPAPGEAARWSARMGQALFRPPTVEGWVGGRRWIHAGTWLERHNALLALVEEEAERGSLAPAFGEPSRDVLVERAVETLLDGAAPAELARALESVADRGADRQAALAAVVQLIVTSPEYHLV